MSRWRWGRLTPEGYRTILADPPWTFITRSARGEGRGACQHYGTMDLAAIQALPVARLAHPEGAACLLWFTSPFLPAAMDTLHAWGFEYRALGQWAKLSRTGRCQHFGMGYWYREAGEHWLLGVRGRVQRQSRAVRSCIIAPTREPSRKPDEMAEDAEALLPGPRVELFARTRRPGWDAWGRNTRRFATA